MHDLPSPDAGAAYESASELKRHHAELLEKLDRLLGQDSDPDSEVTALRRLETEIRAFLRSGAATGVLIEDIRERTACQVFVDYWASTLSHAGMRATRRRLAAFDAKRLPDLSDRTCPFVGLEAFREPRFFFGRAPAVQNLLARVADLPLVVVQGASGSGKSSIVMGGLLPALTKPGGGPRYLVVGPFTPGNRAVESLVEAVAASMGANADAAALRQALGADPAQLPKLLGGEGGGDVLLVVDQFEEVFTLCDEPDRSALVEALTALLDARPGHRVVLTVREEFAAKLETLERLRGRLGSGARFSMSAWPMGYDDLRIAIEQPAAMVNLQFAPGIVDEMVKSVLGHDTALPLLQYALSELWKLRDRNRITREVFAKIGGSPIVALERATEAFYDGLIHEEKVEVERLLVELVFVDALLEPYRRPVLRSRLLTEGTPRTAGLLERLERNHLVRMTPTAGRRDAAVEVKHEALLRNWPRYLGWIQHKRERVRQRIALTEAAQRWFDEGRSETRGLIEEWRLEEVKRIADLNEVEQQYLQASVDAANREREAREAALVRKERRKRRWTIAGLVVVFVAATGVLFEQQRRDDEAAKEEIEQRKALNDKLHEMVKLQMLMAGARTAATSGRLDTAIVGAVRAVDGVHKLEDEGFDDTKALRLQAYEMLQSSLRETADVHRLFVSDRGPLVSVSLAPGPAAGAASAPGLLAYAGSEDRFHVYDAQRDIVRSHPGCPSSVTTVVAFAPSGRMVAAGCEDGSVSVWRMHEGRPGDRLLGGGPVKAVRGKVWAIAFSPDGRTVAVGGHENAVKLLALGEAGPPGGPAVVDAGGVLPAGYVWSLVFAPSGPAGDRLLVGDGVGKVLRCAPAGSDAAWRCEDVPRAGRKDDAIRALAYSSDAVRVAVGTWSGDVSVWDAAFTKEEKVSLGGAEGPVHSLTFFDACGAPALAVSKGNDLRYRSLRRPDTPGDTTGCGLQWRASVGDEVYALAFDAGTGRVAAATRGGYVALVDPVRGGADRLRDTAPGLTSKSAALRGAIVTDDATTALMAVPMPEPRSQLANLELHRITGGLFDRGGEPTRLAAGEGEILRLSASRASRRLATIEKATDGGAVRVAIWQFDEGFATVKGLRSLTPSDLEGQTPTRIALSPDGRRLVVAFSKSARLLWLRFEEGSKPVWIDAGLLVKEIAFSVDGRYVAAGGGPTEATGEAAEVDRVQVWDAGGDGAPAKLGASPWRLEPSAGKVYELAFAADKRDGTQLLVGGARSIERWKVPDGLRLEPLRVGPRAIFRIAFSPERSLVGAADASNVVWVWDTSSWIRTQLTPDDEAKQTPGLLAFGDAGRWLANGARNLEVWDLDLESLKRKACRLLPRSAEGDVGSGIPLGSLGATCLAK